MNDHQVIANAGTPSRVRADRVRYQLRAVLPEVWWQDVRYVNVQVWFYVNELPDGVPLDGHAAAEGAEWLERNQEWRYPAWAYKQATAMWWNEFFTERELECLHDYLVGAYGVTVPMEVVEIHRPKPDLQPLQRDVYGFDAFGEVALPAGQPEGINGVVKGAFVIETATPASGDA